jgi:hypothetical protein
MRDADMRDEGLIRRLADFLHKVLPDYTPERQPKTKVQQSVTPTEIPSIVTPKRDCSSSDDETSDLRELVKTPRFVGK